MKYTKKIKYERPEVFDIGGKASVYGADCDTGSTASDNCSPGGTAGSNCAEGTDAIGYCENGEGPHRILEAGVEVVLHILEGGPEFKTLVNQPLTTPRGNRRATGLEMPASLTTLTTSSTSL